MPNKHVKYGLKYLLNYARNRFLFNTYTYKAKDPEGKTLNNKEKSYEAQSKRITSVQIYFKNC